MCLYSVFLSVQSNPQVQWACWSVYDLYKWTLTHHMILYKLCVWSREPERCLKLGAAEIGASRRS